MNSFNTLRTYEGGGEGCHRPLGGLFELFPVFSSYSFIPRAHFETSLVMVSYVYQI